MEQLLRYMTDQELMDRLAALTERLASHRGVGAGYDFCKMDIEQVQQEIERRREERKT